MNFIHLPKGYSNISEIINSDGFKEYLKNNQPTKKLTQDIFNIESNVKKITMITGKSNIKSYIFEYIKFLNNEQNKN